MSETGSTDGSSGGSSCKHAKQQQKQQQQQEQQSEFFLVKERRRDDGEVQLVELITNGPEEETISRDSLISLRGAKRLIILLLALLLLLFVIHLVFSARIYGYVLHKCGTSENACLPDDGGCHMNATCSDLSGLPFCTCNPGFTGNGTVCTGVNDCEVENGGCHEHADCFNKVNGGRQCKCKKGYQGTGVYCKANPVYLVNYRDCLRRCGGRGGPCRSCGPNGHCCKRGELDCPSGYRSSAPPDRYACVLKLKH